MTSNFPQPISLQLYVKVDIYAINSENVLESGNFNKVFL